MSLYGIIIVNPKTFKVQAVSHNLSRKTALAIIDEMVYRGAKATEVSYFTHSLDHESPVESCQGCFAAITEMLTIMDEEAQRASKSGAPAPTSPSGQNRPRILDSTSTPPEVPQGS